jgi:hypothetical protein
VQRFLDRLADTMLWTNTVRVLTYIDGALLRPAEPARTNVRSAQYA